MRGATVLSAAAAALFMACVPGSLPAQAPEPARPSKPGPPGPALDLTGDPARGAELFKSNCAECHGEEGKGGVHNPGSSDGTVPALNPIDPTIASPDRRVFAANVDLFIEHGSRPEGPSPALEMPAWGDNKSLDPQQIADILAYLIGLNLTTVKPPAP